MSKRASRGGDGTKRSAQPCTKAASWNSCWAPTKPVMGDRFLSTTLGRTADTLQHFAGWLRHRPDQRGDVMGLFRHGPARPGHLLRHVLVGMARTSRIGV